MHKLTTLIAGSLLLTAGPALAQSQGVSATEIVIGTHTALTGPVAPWGIGSTNGIRLRFDEATRCRAPSRPATSCSTATRYS